jgi:hypothetical protein
MNTRQSGFSLLEVMIVGALMVPALAIILRATDMATNNLSADDTVGRYMESLQRSAVRIAAIIRPCSLATYRMESTQVDVDETAAEEAAEAAMLTYLRTVPSGTAHAVGEWIEPADGAARTGIRFQGATGQVSMNAAALTPPRTLRFVRDSGELANGLDDDQDGLIDEGAVWLTYDSSTIQLNSNIERCLFSLTSRTLTITLASAVRRRDGRVQRFTHNEVLFLRNN